jgi:hypothetical protein
MGCNPPVPSDYRLAPAVTARVMGVVLVLIAVMVFAATAAVALLDLHTAVLLVPAVLAIVLLVAATLAIGRRGWVVRFGDEGYRVQWVRGVGVAAARWKDVEDAVTTTRAGSPCVVIRLRNGGTTTIPVDVLAGDREAFVRDLQRHLTDGQGLRPL